VFVALIETPRPEPAAHPALDVPWGAVAVVAIFLALIVAGSLLPGLPGLALVLAAIALPLTTGARATRYWMGCKEHRQ
jgi:hypothetical protein